MHTLWRTLGLWMALLLTPASAFTIPDFTPNVVDPQGYLDDAARDQVEAELQRIREASHIWGAVFIVDSLAGEAIEEVAVAAFDKWQLGRQGIDNGLLLVLAMNDRKSRFEVGYGLEGTITDVAARHALDDYLAPKMREGDIAGAIVDSFGFLSRIVAQDPDAMRQLESADAPTEDWRRALVAWGVYLLFLWSCVPLRNAWVKHRRTRLLEKHPTLKPGDETIAGRRGEPLAPWKSNLVLLLFLSVNPGLFVAVFAATFELALPIVAGASALLAWLVPYLSGHRYRSPEAYRRFLDRVAMQRAELLKIGHLRENTPGVFSYTEAYHESRRSSSSSSGSSGSSSSSSGGGRSGGGGASSGW